MLKQDLTSPLKKFPQVFPENFNFYTSQAQRQSIVNKFAKMPLEEMHQLVLKLQKSSQNN